MFETQSFVLNLPSSEVQKCSNEFKFSCAMQLHTGVYLSRHHALRCRAERVWHFLKLKCTSRWIQDILAIRCDIACSRGLNCNIFIQIYTHKIKEKALGLGNIILGFCLYKTVNTKPQELKATNWAECEKQRLLSYFSAGVGSK